MRHPKPISLIISTNSTQFYYYVLNPKIDITREQALAYLYLFIYLFIFVLFCQLFEHISNLPLQLISYPYLGSNN